MTATIAGAGQLVTVAGAVANGPEDDDLDWLSIDWRQVGDDVRRLRQRIFTASQAGDLKRVRNLQKLMLRSRANTLLSVRRVTEVNAGRATAGVDGKVVLSAISPALFNVALHGMEKAAGVRYHATGTNAGRVKKGSSTLVRFADLSSVLIRGSLAAVCDG